MLEGDTRGTAVNGFSGEHFCAGRWRICAGVLWGTNGANAVPTRYQRGTNWRSSRGGFQRGAAGALGPHGGLEDSPELLKGHTRVL
jgi:hypothetical protein